MCKDSGGQDRHMGGPGRARRLAHLLADAAEALLQVDELVGGLLQVLEGLLHALDGVVHGDGEGGDEEQPIQALWRRQGCLYRQRSTVSDTRRCTAP